MKKTWMKSTLVWALAVGLGLSMVTDEVFAKPSKRGKIGCGNKRLDTKADKARSVARAKATQAKRVAKSKQTKARSVAKAKKTKADNVRKATAKKDKVASKADAKSFKKMDTKSPAYTKTDKMLTKNIGKSGKTYKSRSSAKSDMTKKMATKKYDYKDSKTAMSSRPSYVPQSRMVGGMSYNTSYYGGHYGYYNPTGMFVAYLAADMMINNSMLHSYGYRPYFRPAYHPMSLIGATTSIIIFLIICGCIVIVVKHDPQD